MNFELFNREEALQGQRKFFSFPHQDKESHIRKEGKLVSLCLDCQTLGSFAIPTCSSSVVDP